MKANFEASKTILSLINKELQSKGIKFGIVVIPSKGLVLEQWAVNKGVEIPDEFTVKNKKDVYHKFLEFLRDKDIPVIDATPFTVEAFTKSTRAKENFYPFKDSHPLMEGYKSYSQAAIKLISLINQGQK